MSRKFKSSLAPIINDFLNERHALGYKYEEDERYLCNFDKMCEANFPKIETVTQEAALSWAIAHPDEKRSGFARRLCPIRELARFIIRSGKEAYVIPSECGKAPYRNHVPYIFSNEELQLLFQAADNFRFHDQFPCNSFEVPVILRLLYACGLRPFEGRMILCKNIDLNDGTIFIPESKKLKDRIVVMDEAMLNICREYDEKIQTFFPQREYFFPCHGKINQFHDRHWLAIIMKKCIINSGIADNTNSVSPRPYDLRHTFATHTLYRWMKEGRNLDNCLPYLSAFMGHEKFQHTAYYIHLVPDFFPELLPKIQEKFSYIIPEVENESY